jgi:release factor glutamine methyltransferase
MTTRPTSVGDEMRRAKELGIDRLDAQLLLSRALERSRSWLVANDDAPLDHASSSALHQLFARRAGGEPLAYLLGEKEFHGMLLRVSAQVLVPRPDTEVLVDWGLELLAGELAHITHPEVIDLGTGSGAIALAIKKARPAAVVMATDVSEAALGVAQGNAAHLGLELTFRAGSWWAAASGRRFHLILSNPPYIAAGDTHLEALRHEPMLALSPGGDGLDALRQIARDAMHHLEAGGWLLLEHGYDQAQRVEVLLRQCGFSHIRSRTDLSGHTRCTGARRQP